MKRLVVVAIAGVGAAVAIAAAVYAVGSHGDEVASVGGHSITRDELSFHMRLLAPAVRNAHGSDQDLRDQALASAEKDKVLLLVAEEKGLVDSVDHADFLSSVDAENRRRADAQRRGQVVYGVTSFTPSQYYSKRLTDLRTALVKGFTVSDAEVRAAFDVDPAKWSADATTYSYATLVVPIPPDAPASFLPGVQSRVGAVTTLAAVDAPGARLTNATYAGGSGGVNTHDQDLLAVLTSLKPGQISAPVRGADQITYYELDRQTVDKDKAFTEYAPRIEQQLAAQKLDRYLQDRLRSADIEVDTKAVSAIKPEDVE
jgi:hypothetical protein